jgi:hypothetical protein
MKPFTASVVGVSFEGRQETIRRCVEGQSAQVAHQRDNAYDANAVAVMNTGGEQLGFLPSALAERLVDEYGTGFTMEATIEQVLSNRGTWGLRVAVHTGEAPLRAADDETMIQGSLGAWALDDAPVSA